MKRFTCRAAIGTALLFATTALAKPPKPTPWLETEVKAVRDLLKEAPPKDGAAVAEHDKNLMAKIDPLLEFETLSENALRKHWPTLTPEQRKTFVETFRELVFRSYLKKVRSAGENYTVSYEEEERKGNEATVGCVAKTKKVEIELVFKLEARDDTRWVASDIVIDEVSLVDNYREQFNKIIKESGFDELIKKMRKKLEEYKS